MRLASILRSSSSEKQRVTSRRRRHALNCEHRNHRQHRKHQMKRALICAGLVFFSSATAMLAEDQASSTPKPIPAYRPEMKLALEALKQRQPRLPLPAGDQTGGVNNGRMRAHYLPENWGGGGARGIGGGSRAARS